MPVIYPLGAVSVSSLCSLSFVGSSSKPFHTSVPLYLIVHSIQDYFKKTWGRKQKYINPQEQKASREQHMKQMRVTV